MLRAFGAGLVLAMTLALVQPALAAKKPAVATVPAGYAKVESVDADKMTFTLIGDTTTYQFTKDTTNSDKISVGAVIKPSLKDTTKDQVTGVDVAPAVTPKKKKNN